MQIVFGPEHIGPHLTGDTGSYEWWYFDFIDNASEYSAVIIFLTGNPFSPEYNIGVDNHNRNPSVKAPNPFDFSAISVNLYLKQRLVYRTLFEFGEESYSVFQDENSMRITIDNSSITYDKSSRNWSIDINYNSERYADKLRAEFIFKPLTDHGGSIMMDNKESEYKHFWMPASPVCDVTAKIVSYKNQRRKKIELSGFGYADHNWGAEPMFKGIDDWYWGRVISDDHCLIFYYVKYEKPSLEKFSSLFLFEKNKLVYQSNDFPFEVKNSRNYWMLSYGGTIKGKAGELIIKCISEKLVDNGPFYIRSLADFDVEYKGKSIFRKHEGFSEYISPKRLKSKFLKNFVNLRIKRIS